MKVLIDPVEVIPVDNGTDIVPVIQVLSCEVAPETDPVWSYEKISYYTKVEIDSMFTAAAYGAENALTADTVNKMYRMGGDFVQPVTQVGTANYDTEQDINAAEPVYRRDFGTEYRTDDSSRIFNVVSRAKESDPVIKGSSAYSSLYTGIQETTVNQGARLNIHGYYSAYATQDSTITADELGVLDAARYELAVGTDNTTATQSAATSITAYSTLDQTSLIIDSAIQQFQDGATIRNNGSVAVEPVGGITLHSGFTANAGEGSNEISMELSLNLDTFLVFRYYNNNDPVTDFTIRFPGMPPGTSNHVWPLSVNGLYAGPAGNIVVPPDPNFATGDLTATADRNHYFDNYYLEIKAGTRDLTGISSAYLERADSIQLYSQFNYPHRSLIRTVGASAPFAEVKTSFLTSDGLTIIEEKKLIVYSNRVVIAKNGGTEKNIVLSIAGATADTDGELDIRRVAGKFAVAEEDDSASEHRLFDIGSYWFQIINLTPSNNYGLTISPGTSRIFRDTGANGISIVSAETGITKIGFFQNGTFAGHGDADIRFTDSYATFTAYKGVLLSDAQTGTGAAPHASSIIQMQTTTKGFLPPVVTSVQKSAIVSPATGLVVYQVDSPAGMKWYDGTKWVDIVIYDSNFANTNLVATASRIHDFAGFDLKIYRSAEVIIQAEPANASFITGIKATSKDGTLGSYTEIYTNRLTVGSESQTTIRVFADHSETNQSLYVVDNNVSTIIKLEKTTGSGGNGSGSLQVLNTATGYTGEIAPDHAIISSDTSFIRFKGNTTSTLDLKPAFGSVGARTLYFPNIDGKVLAASVNGFFTDPNGNVTLPPPLPVVSITNASGFASYDNLNAVLLIFNNTTDPWTQVHAQNSAGIYQWNATTGEYTGRTGKWKLIAYTTNTQEDSAKPTWQHSSPIQIWKPTGEGDGTHPDSWIIFHNSSGADELPAGSTNGQMISGNYAGGAIVFHSDFASAGNRRLRLGIVDNNGLFTDGLEVHYATAGNTLIQRMDLVPASDSTRFIGVKGLAFKGVGYRSLAAVPLVADITDGTFQIFKNTSSGSFDIYVNDTGVIKSLVSGSVTASNGLTMSTPTNVQLGGTILDDTTLTIAATKRLFIAGDMDCSSNNISLFQVTNSNANFPSAIKGITTGTGGKGVHGYSSGSGGTGVQAESVSGIGILGISVSNLGGKFTINPTSTNTITDVINIDRQTSGVAADGIGMGITMTIETSISTRESNRIMSKWTTAADASRTSQFIVSGVSNAVTADLFTLSGSGALQLNKYGVGTFNGTPAKLLGVNATGNLVEASATYIGAVTADNGITANTTSNVQLGGTLTKNTTITAGAFQLIMTGNISNSNIGLLDVTNSENTSNGVAIKGTIANGAQAVYGYSSGSGIGVLAQSTTGTGVYASSVSGYAGYFTINPSSTNTIVNVAAFRRDTSGTPANGLGLGISMQLETTSSLWESNRIISKWTNVTDVSRTSQFVISGVNNAITADLLTLSGNGALQLNKYGAGTFTGSVTSSLAVDSGGNIIEIGMGSGMISSVGINLDGQGVTITTGQKGYVMVPFNAVITAYTIVTDQTGTITFDVWKSSGYPVSTDTITAGLRPTLTTGTKVTSSTLTGWTTTVNAGDVIGWNLDSVTLITRAILQLTLRRT